MTSMSTPPPDWQIRAASAARLFNAGDIAAASYELHALYSRPPRHLDTLMLMGFVARAGNVTDEAERCFAAARRLAPADVRVWNIYANSLVASGKFDEALAAFRSLLKHDPKSLDGYINFALTANDAGDFGLAIEIADSGLQTFPGNARLLGIKALALKNYSEIPAALPVFEAAIRAEPNRALTRKNYGAALMAAGEFEAARAEFQQAIRLGLNDIPTHCCLAAAELEFGDIDGAIARYQQILSAAPDHDEASHGLTRILVEYDRPENPFGHWASYAKSRPYEADGWLRWLFAALGHSRFAEVDEIAAEAQAYLANNSAVSAIQYFARAMHGNAEGQMGPLKELVDSGAATFREFLVQVAIKAGDGQLAEQQASILTNETPFNQAAWAYLATAWRMLDDEREFWLCDYERLIQPIEVEADGFDSSVGFANAVAETLASLHQTQYEPGDQSLRNGTQTSGSLFDRRDPMIACLKQALTIAINKWVSQFPDASDHPFLRRKGTGIRFSGSWSVKLRPGGFHIPHFHGQGWISSAYYAQLPSIMDGATENWEGCIGFGEPPAIFGLNHPPRRIIIPKTGTLALFPSYMWHGTIPFSGTDMRLTAAFDMVPFNA